MAKVTMHVSDISGEIVQPENLVVITLTTSNGSFRLEVDVNEEWLQQVLENATAVKPRGRPKSQ